MKRKNGDSSLGIIIIILVILILVAIYFMFFRNNNSTNDIEPNRTNMTDPTTNNTTINDNNYNNDENISSNTDNDIEIVDTNAKALYEKIKNGITLNGKVIEVPAKYLTRLTNKIKVEGYKLSDNSKKMIDDKMAEIENILKTEGKDDINDLSESSKNKINTLIDDIERLL